MAQYLNPNDPSALAPGGSSENRPPQFVGGSIDPTSGNLIPGSRADAANGRTAAIEQDIPEPAQPTTRLASVSANDAPKTDYGKIATDAAINAGVGIVGKGISDTLSGALFGGKGGSSNPLDLNVGGGIENTGAGGNNGGGSAPLFEFPTPGVSSSPSSSPPIDLSPSSSGYGSDSYFSNVFGGGSNGGYGGGVSASSGTVICSELHRQGLLDGITFEADQRFGTSVQLYHPWVYAGYLAWARHVVKLMQVSPRFTTFVTLFATPWAQYMAWRLGERETRPLFGAALHHIGWLVCGAIGAVGAALEGERSAALPAKA